MIGAAVSVDCCWGLFEMEKHKLLVSFVEKGNVQFLFAVRFFIVIVL